MALKDRIAILKEKTDVKIHDKPMGTMPGLAGRTLEPLSMEHIMNLDYEMSKNKKPEDPMEPKGVFKVLDYLMRPNYAIAGAVKAIPEGESIREEFVKGFFGKDRETFSDVLETLGWEPESRKGKIFKGVSGFTLDVLFDPLTYTGFGALTKAGKTATKTGKLLPLARQQAKEGQRALITFMGNKIVTGQKVFDRAGQMLDWARATRAGSILDRKSTRLNSSH